MELRKKIDKILARLLILIMSIMVINVLWLARYLMIWIGILGAAYVSGRNKHVAIDVLPSRLSIKTQKKLKLIVRILIILFCLFALVIGGSRLVYVTYVLDQYSPALQMPLAVVYMIIPISGLLIIYYKMSDILNQ